MKKQISYRWWKGAGVGRSTSAPRELTWDGAALGTEAWRRPTPRRCLVRVAWRANTCYGGRVTMQLSSGNARNTGRRWWGWREWRGWRRYDCRVVFVLRVLLLGVGGGQSEELRVERVALLSWLEHPFGRHTFDFPTLGKLVLDALKINCNYYKLIKYKLSISQV